MVLVIKTSPPSATLCKAVNARKGTECALTETTFELCSLIWTLLMIKSTFFSHCPVSIIFNLTYLDDHVSLVDHAF